MQRLDMRLWRGSFRLWVVVTVIWVGACTLLGINEWYSVGVEASLFELRTADGPLIRRDNIFDQFDVGVAKDYRVKGLPGNVTLIVRKEIPEGAEAARVEELLKGTAEPHIAEQAARRWQIATNATLWAVVPPLMLLALGMALLWVLAGFNVGG